jgi:hypothetical protein
MSDNLNRVLGLIDDSADGKPDDKVVMDAGDLWLLARAVRKYKFVSDRSIRYLNKVQADTLSTLTVLENEVNKV